MDIAGYIAETFPDVRAEETWGVTFFYCGPEVYFATLDEVDGRTRLNLGLPKGTDYSAAGMTPHPEYGRIHWASLVGPDEDALESAKPLIDLAYRRGMEKVRRRSE